MGEGCFGCVKGMKRWKGGEGERWCGGVWEMNG